MPFTVDIHCCVTVVHIHIEYHIDWLIILGESGTCPLDEEEFPVAGQYVVQQPGPSRRHVAVDKQLDEHLHDNHNSPDLTGSLVIETSAWRTYSLRLQHSEKVQQ